MAYDFNNLTKQAPEATNRDKFYTDFEDVDPSKLHQITELTNWMRTKAKGSDVREVIAQLFERTWVEGIKEGNANLEVAQARGRFPVLNDRLNNADRERAENTAQLAQKANKDEVTNVMTPKGTLAYASLPTSGNQVGWYYYCPDGDGIHGAGNYVWNGTSWYFGGTGDEGYNLLKKDLVTLEDDVTNNIYFSNSALTGTHRLNEITFKRIMSKSFYKNLTFDMNEMSFDTNFIDTTNGDMYPVMSGGSLTEVISNNAWNLKNDTAENQNTFRFFGKWNPFASYEMKVKFNETNGYGAKSGFLFQSPSNGITINIYAQGSTYFIEHQTFTRSNGQYINDELKKSSTFTLPEDNMLDFIITFGYESVDIYLKNNDVISPLYGFNYTANIYDMNNIQNNDVWTYIRLGVGNDVDITKVNEHYDCGIAQADLRPIMCKSGYPLTYNGKIYFTCSSRTKLDGYNTVISKEINGGKWNLESVLLFQIGRVIRIHSSTSIVYDEDKKVFHIWNTEFSDAHTLCYGSSRSDMLHGLNIVGMTYMESGITDDTQFKAKEGDEDPCLFFNEIDKKWYLSFCRFYQNEGTYRNFLFKSDNPYTGYEYVDKTSLNDTTGATITKVGGEYVLIVGSGTKYYYYNLNNLSIPLEVNQDLPTGGYRGWGSIFPIIQGDNTKYGWITFDRKLKGARASSYGNIYYYESDTYNNGNEVLARLPF